MKWLLPILLATSGCFSSWAITQASGNQRILDERVRAEHVPVPGVHERLGVSMPLAPEYKIVPAGVATEPLPFALRCRSTQTATDTVYRAGFRYGSTWKKVTALMLALEAGIAAAAYFGGDPTKPGTQVAVGFFGLDALGTAALLFVPRKEIYRRDVEPVVSTLRTDCPAGLLLDVAGETFPVDAAGRIGELGEAALDAWMRAPTTLPIRVTYREHVIDLAIGHNEVCTWNRTRHEDPCPAYWVRSPAIAGSVEVPMGTLTQLP
ncbi:MAG: hypothetical protein M4D80_01090 [Myxococcota bacterium]|nr:hypothetical protein [Deltaproteobacteria bacterium]MDQ3333750.1 hypothetical protein [Myxococcota bacterium]